MGVPFYDRQSALYEHYWDNIGYSLSKKDMVAKKCDNRCLSRLQKALHRITLVVSAPKKRNDICLYHKNVLTLPPFLRNSNPFMQPSPCHISVVSPVYRGEKMVSELVRRIVQAMHTIATDSACSAAPTDAATAPAGTAAANGTLTTLNSTPSAANTLNPPPPW